MPRGVYDRNISCAERRAIRDAKLKHQRAKRAVVVASDCVEVTRRRIGLMQAELKRRMDVLAAAKAGLKAAPPVA